MPRLAYSLALLFAAGFLACSSSGAGGREIKITQSDDGCTPASVDVEPGEKLNLVAKNETGQTYEIEGTDGTQLEEVLVPEGRSRSVGYTVPDEPGVHKVKCYQPGGVSTIIELRAGESASAPTTEPGATEEPSANEPFDTAVDVQLEEFTVTPDRDSAPAGKVRFSAANLSETMVHELAVLQVADDGTFDVAGEIEDIAAGDGGVVTLELEPGNYQLACLIVPGEAGSTADHYQEGMHTAFTVE